MIESQAIGLWWERFAADCDDIDGMFSSGKEFPLAAWMEEHLSRIHSKLMWEFGPALSKDGHCLVITPEARHHLRPLTRKILAVAPRLPRWEFYGYRQREDVDQAISCTKSRTEEDPSHLKVFVQIGQYNRIDLLFYSDRFTTPEDAEAANGISFIVAECILGEEDLDKWIGVLETVVPSEVPREGIPLA